MDIELSKIIVPAIAGLLSGAVGSLIAPWIHWGIEKRKQRRETQASLLNRARSFLGSETVTNKEFSNHQIYSQLKPHLSAQAVKAVEGEYSDKGEVISVVIGNSRVSGVNPFKNLILDELAALEKKWGLI